MGIKEKTYDVAMVFEVRGTKGRTYKVSIEFGKEKEGIKQLAEAISDDALEVINKVDAPVSIKGCYLIEAALVALQSKMLLMAQKNTPVESLNKTVKTVSYKLVVNGRTVKKAVIK